MKIGGKILSAALLLGIVSCNNHADIDNVVLSDRVKACSAGFSSSTRAGLHAQLAKASLQGNVGGEFGEETKSMIFDELSLQDREKGYRDYIGCIKENWSK
jgi:hypothetical protein